MIIKKLLFLLLFVFAPFLVSFSCNAKVECDEQEYLGEEIEVDEVSEFSGTAIDATLNTTATGNYNYPFASVYFKFESTERQFVKLNFSGQMSELKVYNYYYYSSNDYLFYSSQITYDTDIIYCDANQTYILAFKSNLPYLSSISITLTSVTVSNLSNHEKYLMHITYDSTSSLGYRYDVEYKNINLNTTTETIEYIDTNGGFTNYLDLLDNDLNFGITNDDRRLVSNPGECQYSAIAQAIGNFIYYVSDDGYSYSSYGTGTFVDETTVLSCAHLFYHYNGNALSTFYGYSALTRQMYFYPGANSYYNQTNWYSNYGKYKATDTYVPISYVLVNSGQTEYDWSLTLTDVVSQGSYNHSYMRMYHFTASINYSVQSAGYPVLQNVPNGEGAKYAHTMWASYPLYRTIMTYNNYLSSPDIVLSGGNSGGPIYVYVTSMENGVVIRRAGIAAIASATNTGSTFTQSYMCRMRPVIINAYYSIT